MSSCVAAAAACAVAGRPIRARSAHRCSSASWCLDGRLQDLVLILEVLLDLVAGERGDDAAEQRDAAGHVECPLDGAAALLGLQPLGPDDLDRHALDVDRDLRR